MIKKRMKAAQSRQKAYADQCRRTLEFVVGDKVFLKVSQMKRVVCTSRKNKLHPQHIGPFELLERIGPLVSWLALPWV